MQARIQGTLFGTSETGGHVWSSYKI